MSQLKHLRNVGVLIVALAVIVGQAPRAAAGPQAPELQAEVISTPGRPVFLLLDPNPSTHRTPPPAEFLRAHAQNATFTVNYLPAGATDAFGTTCLTWPTAAQTAFSYAASIWGTLINSSVPIVINACWADLESGVLGYGGAGGYARNFTNAPQANTWYPVALASSFAGSDLNGANAEMHLAYNKDYADTNQWYYGTDGNPGYTQLDFVSVVLHEIAHGLGFSGSMSWSGGQGSWGGGNPINPIIYDRFTEDGAGNSLINTAVYPNPSVALGNALTSNNIYFDGANANAANGGQRVKLYAPSTWQSGSSYSHLDEIFNGTQNALMTYALANGEANHSPGPVAMGIMKDIGWTTPSVVPAPTVSSITPNNGANTGAVDVTIGGANFQSGATVKLTRSGQSDIVATNVNVASATQITCRFNLAGAAVGQWNVVVTNPDAQSGQLANGFTIAYPAPTVSSINPNSGNDTETVNVAIGGSNFRAGATAKLTRSGQADIAATNVSVASATQINCSFNLLGRAAGAWNVVVTNSDGQSGQLNNGFTINHVVAPDIAIQAGVVGQNHQPGDPIALTIAIVNQGDGAASQIVVTDDLPAEVLSPAVNSSLAITRVTRLSAQATRYVWQVQPLNPGARGVITISGQIDPALPTGFSFVNRVTASAAGETVTTNNSASVLVGIAKLYLPLVVRNYPPIPAAPTLNAISDPEGDGNYTVSWSAVQMAQSYTLQEDDNSAFSSPTDVYSGAGTSTSISGKAAGSTWYYRVRANNPPWYSAWSNTQSVTVQPPATGSTPGFWQDTETGTEFYVTPDSTYVTHFAIYVNVQGCGTLKITRASPNAISNDEFEFTDSFYAWGAFDSATTAYGYTGLNNYYSYTCGGYLTGGPWFWSADWQNSSQPSIPAGATGRGTVEALVAGVDAYPATRGE